MASRKEGTSLGPYRLIEQIGLGGMATVYKAYQPSMDRYVALKILPAHFAQDPKFIERFNREARTIAKLEHRNILPVYDFGEENGVTYLVMRYLNGGTLKDMLALGRLTLSDAVSILGQVCAALDYAHRQGVVHRDVKPANIMVDSEGTVYLTDFGIAKVLEGAPGGLTETGAAIGTPAYMAPEQSLGQPIDRRSDIYALGVILYEMVVGRAPYQADTPMAIALAHIHEPLPMPREINPDVPEPLERVILKALTKKPDDRYESACDMSTALEEALAESGIARGDTTLKALATRARDVISSQTVKVTPGAFATVRAGATPAPPRRGLSPLAIGAAILGGVVVIALAVVAGIGLAGRGGTPTPAVQAATEPPVAAPTSVAQGATEPVAAQPSDASPVYDSFDNPAYDGKFDPSLWAEKYWYKCTYSQTQGVIVANNELSLDEDPFCGLSVIGPNRVSPAEMGTLQVRLKISHTSDQGGSNNVIGLRGFSGDDMIWMLGCGVSADPKGTWAHFDVQNIHKDTYAFQESAFRDWPVESDHWYTFQMKVDPETMAFTCLVDGKLLASVAPDNAVGVKDQLIERELANWRSVSSVAVGSADDFAILPPE